MSEHARPNLEVELERKLRCVLEGHYPDWQPRIVGTLGHGMEAVVFLVDTRHLGRVTIRVPRQRWAAGASWCAMAELIDGRHFLQRDLALSELLKTEGLPATQVHHVHLGEDDFDFTVAEYIANDSHPVDDAELGQIMARIHSLEPPGTYLDSLIDHACYREVLFFRMSRRLAGLQQGHDLPGADVEVLRQVLDRAPEAQSILHLDLRRDNILSRQGAVCAVIDWSSSILGHPALEWARMAEYQRLSYDFTHGYRWNPVQGIEHEVMLAFRLDAALMLAYLFTGDAYDEDKADYYLGRVRSLTHQLQGCTQRHPRVARAVTVRD